MIIDALGIIQKRKKMKKKINVGSLYIYNIHMPFAFTTISNTFS